MDRELAEEFIEQTMDPGGGAGVDQSQTMSGTESEAWWSRFCLWWKIIKSEISKINKYFKQYVP